MKKITVALALISLFNLTACNQQPAAQVEQVKQPQSFITPENLKEVSLDAVFGIQKTLTSGTADAAIDVQKLQNVLKAWPQSAQSNQEPCYMQLKNETTRILNLIDGLQAVASANEPDYRYECRQSISYKFDQSRVDMVWNRI